MTTLAINTLKPGLLVSIKTTIQGGVNYQRVELEPDHQVGEGRRARWETQREIADAAEFEEATKIRGQARSLITAVCCPSSFGLLCPQDKEPELLAAIQQARELAADFNRRALRSSVRVYALAGRVARDDAEAARAIRAELAGLMEDMRRGILACDVTAIREAANKARALGAMLSPGVAGQVDDAIKQARAAAREIVKRVEKAGEAAADVVADLSTARIEGARFTFLDLDEARDIEHEAPAARPLELPAEAPQFDAFEYLANVSEPEPQAPQLSAAPVQQRALEI